MVTKFMGHTKRIARISDTGSVHTVWVIIVRYDCQFIGKTQFLDSGQRIGAVVAVVGIDIGNNNG